MTDVGLGGVKEMLARESHEDGGDNGAVERTTPEERLIDAIVEQAGRCAAAVLGRKSVSIAAHALRRTGPGVPMKYVFVKPIPHLRVLRVSA